MAYDPYTKSLLHFNGINQSQVFTDELGNVWTAEGTAQLDTDQKVFGSASGRFNGDSAYITTPLTSDFAFGTGNFTIDFWIRWLTTVAYSHIIGIGSSTYYEIVHTGTQLYPLTDTPIDWTPTADTWYHVAIIRVAGVTRAFVNGSQIGSDQANTADYAPTGTYVGVNHGAGGSSSFNGWIEEVRFSNGIARWTAAFTPSFYEYGESIFTSTSIIIVPTVTNLITVTAEKFWGIGTILLTTLYNETWAGDADLDLPTLTCVATGHDGTAEVSVTLPLFTISATGQSGIVGALAQILPALTVTGLGGAYAEATLPAMTLAATGKTGAKASLSQSLPVLICTGYGFAAQIGRMAVDLPKLTVAGHGYNQGMASASISLPMLMGSASGLCGQVGNMDQLLPRFTMSGSGYVVNDAGQVDLDLPMFYIYASGHQTEILPEYLVLAMNPKNMAVSEYDWSGFNSFAYFNGHYLGAKAGTIHVLGGDDDAGSIIESEIELGQIAVDSAKPRDVYVLGRASGMMALTVMADEDTEKEVKIAYMLETLNLDRAKIPRGIQPTYFSLKLENRNGSDFDIDEIQVYGEGLKRGKP